MRQVLTIMVILLLMAGAKCLDAQAQEQRLNMKTPTERKLDILEWKVKELERKVAGMQKQITILHAKKADK